jgi:fibronectin-binding autotransporter adhesin
MKWCMTFMCILVLPLCAQRQMEDLGRGMIALRKDSTRIYVGWRLLGKDPEGIAFNLYRSANGGLPQKLNATPLSNTTDYTDTPGSLSSTAYTYSVRPVLNGLEVPDTWAHAGSAAYALGANPPTRQYFPVPLQATPDGAHKVKFCWVGDLDGDGEFDFVVDRYNPETAARQFLEAYKRDGTFLWRMNMGPNSVNQYNIEPGSSAISIGHGDNVTVYDLDGDGKAEVLVRTANGVVLGDGNTVTAANENIQYLSVIDGLTGAERARATVPNPHIAHGPLNGHMAIFYPDGKRPSVLLEAKNRRDDGGFQGIITTWDFRDGALTQRWSWNGAGQHAPEGHQIRIGDPDNDGKDEFCDIGYSIDDDGTLLYSIGEVTHGDRFHTTDVEPDRPGLETFIIQQNNPTGLATALFDAGTGTFLKKWYAGDVVDVGRGVISDMDAGQKGYEMFSTQPGIFNGKGEQIYTSQPFPPETIWWDADLGREFIATVGSTAEAPAISKFNPANPANLTRLYTIYNETAPGVYQAYGGRPAFWGDILGDWREELLCVANDNSELRIYTTKLDASARIYTPMHNPQYRCQTTTKGYVQSSYTDYYLGYGMTEVPPPPMSEAKLVWRGGTGSSAWDSGITPSWKEGGLNANFASGDRVLFDLSGDASTAVQLDGVLQPGAVDVRSPDDFTIDGGAGSLAGTMTLVKSGAGSLILSGNHSYTGKTTVWDGALIVNGTLQESPVTVWGGTWGGKGAKGTSGGRIGGSGTIAQPLTLGYRGSIVPGNGMGHAGTLSLGNLTTMDGSVLAFDLASTPVESDRLVIQGNLSLTGTVHVVVQPLGGTLAAGTYTLLSYSGSLSGSAANLAVSVPPGTPYTLSLANGALTLNVPVTRAPAAITWRGSGATWDLASSPNWLSGGLPETFVGGDEVRFDDSGSGSPAVTLATALPVSGLTVDATTNYSFSGSGSIHGPGGLRKSGSGTLTLGTENHYTGATVIDGGVLAISALGDGGSPSSIGASSGAASNLVVNGGTLRLTGLQTNTNRNLTLGVSGATLDIALANSSMQISGSAGGSGTLVKTGPGTLILASANTYNGGTVINGGKIYLAGATANSAGLGSGSVTLNNGTLSMADVQASETAAWNLIVPAGATARLEADGRCSLTGSLTGSGDFTFYTPYVRTELYGNWSAFSGRIMVVTDSDGGDFRVRNTAGFPDAAIHLGDEVYAYYQQTMGSNLTVPIGTLSGSASSTLLGGPTAGRTLTWLVGGRNENAVFQGSIANSAGTTALTKTGTGVLTLGGGCTHSGATVVQQGTLRVNGSTTGSAFTVAGGAALGGSGTINGSVAIQAGGVLEHGALAGTPLVINGSLAFAGAPVLRPAVAPEAGTYTVLTYTGSLSGNPQFTWQGPPGVFLEASFSIIAPAGADPGRIELTLVSPPRPPGNVVWTGSAGFNWDESTANWLLDGDAVSYQDGDTVNFTDAGNATSPILIGAELTPTAVIVDASKNYNFGGTGTIGGGGVLTKSGSGTLSLTNALLHGGGTYLTGGTLFTATEAAMSSLGSGPVIFQGGTLQQLDGNGSYSSANYALQVPAGQSGTFRADSRMDLSGSLSGSGTLTIHVPWVRFKILGDWSPFAGVIQATTDADGGLFRFANTSGVPAAALDLSAGVTVLSYLNQAHTVPLGTLSGPAGSVLSGIVPDNNTPGSHTVTWRIGDRGGDSVFSGVIQNGAGTSRTGIEKAGSGILTLAGANTYTGPTTVNAGELRVNGSLANTTVVVATGGTLGGTGTLGGAVSSPGKLKPGNSGTGTLTFGNGLALTPGSVLEFDLGAGAASDKVQVDGALVLDGTVNFTAAPGFGAGIYTLAAYTGTLTDNSLNIGTMPDGFTGSVAASGGSVRITVAAVLTPYEQWQIANFGSSSDPAAAAGADPDGDGTLNETEFRLALDPKNGISAFRASGARTEAGFTIQWPAAAGVQFEVRRATDTNGIWQAIGTVNGSGTFTDTSPPAGKGFYRIVLLP